MEIGLAIRTLVTTSVLFLSGFGSTQDIAIPQPDVIFYGSYTASGDPDPTPPSSLTWTISGNSESIEVTEFRLVTVQSQTFYLARIPFEVRELADGTWLDPTPGRLELTALATGYTRSALVDGESAVLPEGKEDFSYGAPVMGLIERIDLTRNSGTSYEDWSLSYFGRVVDPDGDEDGDGLSNDEEFRAGTIPDDPASGLFVGRFALRPGGGFELEVETVEGIQYQFEKSNGPGNENPWTPIGGVVTGDGSVANFITPDDGGSRECSTGCG